MTKKHYISLAKQIAAEKDGAKRRFAFQVVVNVAQEDNPRFDINRFRLACDVPEDK